METIVHKTTACSRFSHPEISVLLDRRAGFSPDWLIQYFETEVGKGRVFKAGQTVQVGWGLVQLRDTTTGELELWEPDFLSMPLHWQLGANETLRHLIVQKSLAEALQCEPDFPSLRQPGSVEHDWKRLAEFHLWRQPSHENHSGWFFAADTPAAAVEYTSLYELACHAPAAIAVMGLPQGAEAQLSRDSMEVRYAGRSISSADNQLLRGLHSRYRDSLAHRPG
ncbi:MAG TPA: hypothetical protein VNO35_22345 [Steroidobacteraceae bacterium]|nr:hypothetical protein [Steroidobacteraceae bacterium]